MNINIITAMSKNRGIGLNNVLPWNLKKDLKRFKKLTSDNSNTKNAIIMGKNTWNSLPIKPLPNRSNFVISKTLSDCPNVNILRSPSDIKNMYKDFDTIWICGGEKIYNYYIHKPYINKLYITNIHKDFKADTFFPSIPINYTLYEKSKTYNEMENALSFINFDYSIYKNNIYYNVEEFYEKIYKRP